MTSSVLATCVGITGGFVKEADQPQSILPPLEEREGLELADPLDLLDSDEQAQLQRVLALLAKNRRESEAESSNIRLA